MQPGSSPIKRFYGDVTIESAGGGFYVLLDGRATKSRNGQLLLCKTASLANAVADEWRAQEEVISFISMPLTRLTMATLGLEPDDRDAKRNDVCAYARSDLLCYRTEAPAELAERQCSKWDPLLNWAREELGLTFLTTAGVGHVEQPESTVASIDAFLKTVSDGELVAVKLATELSGSAVLALALLHGAFSPESLYEASRVDEEFQAERWGVDDESAQRWAAIKADFEAVSEFIRLLRAS